ncbi:MAG: hypothetical protein IPM25_20225 [Chloracidobacterium sp.]|nr:hypothetical protein [Chloracidobacterium sp.]
MLSAGYEPDSPAIAEALEASTGMPKLRHGTPSFDLHFVFPEPGRSIIADVWIRLTTVRNAKSFPLSDNTSLMEDAMNIHRRRETKKTTAERMQGFWSGIYSIQRGFVIRQLPPNTGC